MWWELVGHGSFGPEGTPVPELSEASQWYTQKRERNAAITTDLMKHLLDDPAKITNVSLPPFRQIPSQHTKNAL